MKLTKIKSSFIIGLLSIVGVVSSASAALITVNEQSIQAYDIQNDRNASSFAEFYNYQGNIVDDGILLPYSSNTGFEIPNQIVMMLVKNETNFGLIGLISGRGGIGGGVTMNYQSSHLLSAFIDDPDEIKNGGHVTTSEVKWRYFKNRGDGFIFSGFNSSAWDIVTSFKDFSPNIKGGITVLSFDENNRATSLMFDRNDNLRFSSANQILSVASVINAPGTVGLFLLTSFVFLLQLKRKK